MEVKTTQKFIRTSPRKLREVAALVRGLTPQEAVEILPHVGKRAATPLLKAIKTALANAGKEGTDKTLVFKEIQINEGPRLKRWRAGAKGNAKPYKKRMSHIRIVLTINPKTSSIKTQTNLKTENKKGGKKRRTHGTKS